MSRPEEFSTKEVFLSKIGMSKHALKESTKGLPQPTISESMIKPEDFTSEEVFLSKIGMSKRSLKDTHSKPQ
jgi:hypothetical protein